MAGLLMLLAMPEELHAQNPVSDSTEVSVREPDRTSRRESRRDRRKKENIPSADERLRPSEQKLDSLVRSRLDSATIARMDSIAAAKRDSIARVLADTTTDRPGAIDRPAFSTARDSIVEDFSGKYKMIYYYGDVSVEFGEMKMTAEYMEYNVDTKTVFASGIKDTTGNWIGQPTMTDHGQTYTMEKVIYNFETRKSRIKNMITQEEEGNLYGKNIKMLSDKSINMRNGRYTVCDCEDPHFYLNLTTAKVMTEPKQRTVFGPAYMVVEDVPIYPLMLPFGFVPSRPDRATGLLMPTFGDEGARGFYMKDLGIYLVMGDYFDIALTGDIYTLGSWQIDVSSRYKVNYKFNGSFGLTYSNDQTGEKGSTDFFQTRNFSVKWSHTQDPKARPGTSFSASVNFSSPSNNKYNSNNINEALQTQTSSSISWSRRWNKVTLSLSGQHSQNSRDSSYSITLPNLSLSVSTFYPFKRKVRVGKEKLYEQISFSYNTSFQNKINFKSSEVGEPGFWDKLNNGMTHNFSIGLPSFTLFKYLNVNPSISYGMNWYFSKTTKEYNPETGQIEDNKGGVFSSFGATHRYSGSISLDTRIYGLFNFGTQHKLQAIRHMISPSLSVNFQPELGTAFNGWRSYKYIDANGQEQVLDYNIYSGQLNAPPSKGKTASLTFNINNNFEAKVRDLKDTTGTGTKKIKLIDQLNISGGYNFLADSMKLQNFRVTLSTNIFGKLGVNANMTLDPYAVNERGQRIGVYNAVQQGWTKPVRLTNASVSLSYTLSGEGKINGMDGQQQGGGAKGSTMTNYMRTYRHPVTGEYIPGGWLYYVNPNAPWSISFRYSYVFTRGYKYANERLMADNRHTQALSVDASFKITPSLSMQISTGFDLMAMKMTTTQLTATYDMHCFNIQVTWIPSGQWEQWSFKIAANASTLADILRFKKSTSYWDN
ncbi:MAG: LPS-assembly protein LptD [Bacteroidetes bacterium]|uniref:LPS-assembly protein LptD n=1 Tax=Candidatus Merdivivens pullistercoris TaxID=2840873 RepID=A0A9D9I302_9BACT|nr:LPS-assembly protein LptD [Candidatus Merdivivens pullistercoris]